MDPLGGHVDPLGGCGPPMWALFGKMCAKMKELGPIGGVRPARPLDPPMQTV